jgi:hypothetical protein
MVVEIKKGDTPKEMAKKLQALSDKISQEKKARLSKLFGTIKLKEDAVTLQRKWRDEGQNGTSIIN